MSPSRLAGGVWGGSPAVTTSTRSGIGVGVGVGSGSGSGSGDGGGSGSAGREHVVRLAHRQFFPAELMQLVRSAGFLVIDRYGGFQGEALEDGSESQLLLCVSGDQVSAGGQKK